MPRLTSKHAPGLLAVAAIALAPTVADAAPSNPCLDPNIAPLLLCPDLAMSKPFNLYLDKRSYRHHRLLRAANSINNIGEGPAELRGTRVARKRMNAVQHIHKVSGRLLRLNTGARLRFKTAYGHGRFWKFDNAARFELWRLNSQGIRTRRVRVGPKVIYCLRDLAHTRPDLNGSPQRRVYPACNQNPRKRSVTLGTSVGWSDIYPATYYEQWIDVTGLRGCFAYEMTADPLNHIYELNEDNNSAETIVRLPYKGGARGCKAAPSPSEQSPVPDPPSGGY